MAVFHRECGGEVKSSGKGDWGICDICKKRVDHLVVGKNGKPAISKEVEILW